LFTDLEALLGANANISVTALPPQTVVAMDTDNKHVAVGEEEIALISRVSLPRIPYNNGYRDFCFGRWADRPKTSLKGNFYTKKFWEREAMV
jgi:hypothetical protein